jgi:hypothetical protein
MGGQRIFDQQNKHKHTMGLCCVQLASGKYCTKSGNHFVSVYLTRNAYCKIHIGLAVATNAAQVKSARALKDKMAAHTAAKHDAAQKKMRREKKKKASKRIESTLSYE